MGASLFAARLVKKGYMAHALLLALVPAEVAAQAELKAITTLSYNVCHECIGTKAPKAKDCIKAANILMSKGFPEAIANKTCAMNIAMVIAKEMVNGVGLGGVQENGGDILNEAKRKLP